MTPTGTSALTFRERIAAIEDGVSMAEALRKAIELWLKERKRARKEIKK